MSRLNDKQKRFLPRSTLVLSMYIAQQNTKPVIKIQNGETQSPPITQGRNKNQISRINTK